MAVIRVALFRLCRFTDDAPSVTTLKGAHCSVFFQNQLYDNVGCSRKGVTSLSWPKPKLKINFKKDNV